MTRKMFLCAEVAAICMAPKARAGKVKKAPGVKPKKKADFRRHEGVR